MKDGIIVIFMIIGTVLVVSANVVGIGYGIYLWGVQEMALGLAAWTAFKIWIIMIVVGLITLLTSLVSQ